MFSKSQIKLITSLAQKKYRTRHKLFIAEGKKVISELLVAGLRLHSLYMVEDTFKAPRERKFLITEAELKKISQLKTTQSALAVFEIPGNMPAEPYALSVALDGVRDPGNLGTIIRLCDWFGIKQLFCSPDTVDCYNPKVVQATMGSIARVDVIYTDLSQLFIKYKDLPVFGAFMEGENVYTASLPEEGILVMGNEANGITSEIQQFVTKKISIPQFGEVQETESLNVATAASILVSEFKRRTIKPS